MTLYRGRLGVRGHVDYAGTPAKGKPKLLLALAIDVSDVATRDDRMNEEFVSWHSLQLDAVRYQMAPDALSIGRIARQWRLWAGDHRSQGRPERGRSVATCRRSRPDERRC